MYYDFSIHILGYGTVEYSAHKSRRSESRKPRPKGGRYQSKHGLTVRVRHADGNYRVTVS